MFQFFRGDIKKVGQECHKLSDPGFKRNCFNALARQIHPLTDGKTERVFEMCKLMPGEWVDYCIATNAVAYLGVGDTELPFDICEEMQDPGRGECYKALIGPMKFLNVDLCDKISDETWRNKCKQG